MSSDSVAHSDHANLAEVAMAWSGWGSPVGIGILVVCIGLGAFLLRLAITGL